MRVFIAILLLSGYCSVSRRRLYWSTELDTRNEMIAQSVRRNRFDNIIKYFHATNIFMLKQDDKFAKVCPFLDIINKNFLSYSASFGPKNVSIVELMLFYFERHPSKQFICGKPIRWGYKVWMVASPLDYVFSVEMYQGKYRDKRREYKSKFGFGGEVVLDFVDILEKEKKGKKFSLYFDNFFTSFGILKKLKQQSHCATGTVSINRREKCPFSNNNVFAKLPRGSEEHFIDQDTDILVARWSENDIVTIASNECGIAPSKEGGAIFCCSERKGQSQNALSQLQPQHGPR